MTRKAFVLSALLTCFTAAGCLSVGRNFNSADLSWITPGVTTRQHMQQRLGEPFRVGVDSNKPTWTYGYYAYRLIGETATKDLVVYFTMDGIVDSFTFSTSFPDEKKLWSNPGRP